MKPEVDDSVAILATLDDQRPTTLRRKRSTSTRRLSRGQEEQRPLREDSIDMNVLVVDRAGTPTKSKKRVRFSDPGPDVTTASSSTGLTPRLNRTFLSIENGPVSPAHPRLLQARPRRRASLPALSASSLPSPSLTPPTTPCLSGEIQFASLHQILDGRTKRRLARRGMSDEMNDYYDARRRTKGDLGEEIRHLKQELDEARQNTLGQVPYHEHSASRVQELETELQRVTNGPRARSATAAPPAVDENGPSPATPESEVFCDHMDDEDLPVVGSDESTVLQDKTHEILYNVSHDQTTQASLPSPGSASTFRAARIALEHLFPGEITLGLDIADPKPILDTMLDRLQTFKGQAIFAAENLRMATTQESNMRHQFNAVLQQLERARGHAQVVSAQVHAERARAEKAEESLGQQEQQCSDVTRQNHEHERDLEEKERSIHKLGDALNAYRAEVKKLERLITNMEGDHTQALAEQRGDLECHVRAETVGRREAEQLASARLDQIKTFEHRENELRHAVHEKQSVIRHLETQMTHTDLQREKEVGRLNAQISLLTSSLEAAEFELLQMQAEKTVLFKSIDEERSAGVKAVDTVQAEWLAAARRTDQLKHQYTRDLQSRGEEVNEHKGLLTPVSTCRFKNVDAEAKVEGHVEVHRGHKAKRTRPDSGIGVLQEEMEEESFMIDV